MESIIIGIVQVGVSEPLLFFCKRTGVWQLHLMHFAFCVRAHVSVCWEGEENCGMAFSFSLNFHFYYHLRFFLVWLV